MSYSVGFVILAHENLGRVAQLARYLAEQSCPVVIHIDSKTPDTDFTELKSAVADVQLIGFRPRLKTEWGGMSLVNATLLATEKLLASFPDVGHVMLNSGSCLPAQPIKKLQSFLSKNQGSDFIESVSIESRTWVQDGLSAERFKYYFPFSWKKQRRLFDAATLLQKKLKINRKFPTGIAPHFGSQWWCLTRRTLQEIINDPKRPSYDRFFSKTWIPDESYFQTLARKHSERLESKSLTWSKFDADGKPFLLYDDHLNLDPGANVFMYRKVWHKADGLYENLLSANELDRSKLADPAQNISEFFEMARMRRNPSESGKVNPGRFPTGDAAKRNKTVRPYTVLIGAQAVYPEMKGWLSEKPAVLCHGNLFDKDGVEFAGGVDIFDGSLSANRLIRNYRAPAFLANVIWNRRDIHQAFFYDLGDNQKAHDAIFKDPNAKVIMIKEAWILHYMALSKLGADTRSKAKLLHAGEQRLKRVIARASTQAKIIEFDIGQILRSPTQYLLAILDSIGSENQSLVPSPIHTLDIATINETIRYLRNEGFKLETSLINDPHSSDVTRDQKPRLIDG